jgi:hypothetical protein
MMKSGALPVTVVGFSTTVFASSGMQPKSALFAKPVGYRSSPNSKDPYLRVSYTAS